MTAKKTDSKKGTRSTGFLEKYSFYAAFFGESERSIKRWVKEGRDKNDPVPMDQPEQMMNWWSRVRSQRVPDRILKLAPVNGDDVVADDPLFNQDDPPTPQPKVVPFEIPDNLNIGLAASVERLREAEAIANHQYVEAIKRNADEGEIERKQRAWERVSKQLGISEKSLLEMQGKYGSMYGAAEIKKVLSETHMVVYSGVKNFMRRVLPRAELIEDPIDRQAFYDGEVNKLFRHFGESEFAAPVEELVVCES